METILALLIFMSVFTVTKFNENSNESILKRNIMPCSIAISLLLILNFVVFKINLCNIIIILLGVGLIILSQIKIKMISINILRFLIPFILIPIISSNISIRTHIIEFLTSSANLYGLNITVVLKVSLGILIATKYSGVFIADVLDGVDEKNKEIESIHNNNEKLEVNDYGMIIGMLERSVIVLLGTVNVLAALTVVITSKTLTRFDLLKNKKFAEKYLIGTMLSILVSLFCIFIIG